MPEMDGALLVTTGSQVAQSVVERSKQYALDLGIRVLGVIQNLSNLFGSAAENEEILGRIPYDPQLATSLDTGTPLPKHHPVSRLFENIAGKLLKLLP